MKIKPNLALTIVLFFALLMQKNTPVFANINIPKDFQIITRQNWGANEEITFEKIETQAQNGTTTQNGEITTDETEGQSEIKKQDPEIKKIIEEDKNNKKYIWPLQYAKKIRFIVIHHTASASNLDKPKTALQNIEYYHAVTRKWGDIGYNYIIDPEGNIYEGRKGGERVISGHAKPLNKTSIGIAVLGNYEKEELPVKALKGLLELITAKAKLHRIDITEKTVYEEKTYPNLQGHYENSATACPGQFIKQKIPGIKKLVAYKLAKEEKADPEKYDFRDIDARDLIVTAPDKTKQFTIRLKNTGKIAWNKNTFLEMANFTSRPGLKIPKILAKLQTPKRVKPGSIGVFKGTMPQMLISGLHVPDASLVINGTIRPQKTIPVPIFVEGLKMNYEIVGRFDPPATMKAGQTAQAWIMLKNTGNFTWKRGGETPVRIGTSNPADRKSKFFAGKNRIASLVEKEVKPGQTGKFVFNLKAPGKAGSYVENFQPVIENVSWMPDQNMHFSIQVEAKTKEKTEEAKEKPIRVALGINKTKPQIKSSTGMKLYEGEKLVHEFGKNETVAASPLVKGGWRIVTEKEKFEFSGTPRFSANQNGILTVVNFENRPAWNTSLNDNMFRGILEMRRIDKKTVVINELPLKDYLKGIAEISNSDPKEKIKTIIILARSYAKYYRDIARKFPGKPYDLDDNPDHTQKYNGYGLEMRSPNIVAAVEETAGKIVTYQNKPVITPYFTQSDGRTRSAEEVWGWKNTPFLQSVPDGFCGSKELKGHGVGLSGCGAAALARQGKSAEEIIKYYYKGVEITD